jgi:hypothetical protein
VSEQPDELDRVPRPSAVALAVNAASCSLQAVDRGEALAGTASQVRRWIVLEQPGPWGPEALVQSRLRADVAQELSRRAKAADVRVLLVRRPAWEHPEGAHRLHLVSTQPLGGWVEQVDLDAPTSVLDVPLDRFDHPEPPGIGAPGPVPLLLVCTHGRHDACCANEGRPVIRSLVAAGVPDVWETSHVGGHRFAATLVALPWGVYLGRLRAEVALDVATDLRSGLLPLGHYRGRSCHSSTVQAADVAVRQATGERRVLAVQLDGPVASRELPGGEEVATVPLTVDGAPWVAEVRRWRGDPVMLSCGADPSRPWLHEVLDLRPR